MRYVEINANTPKVIVHDSLFQKINNLKLLKNLFNNISMCDIQDKCVIFNCSFKIPFEFIDVQAVAKYIQKSIKTLEISKNELELKGTYKSMSYHLMFKQVNKEIICTFARLF